MGLLLLSLAAERLAHAQRLVESLFPSSGDAYASRMAVGRRALLGDEMIYRSTIGGGGGQQIDSALTYGEYDLAHFYDLVSRAGSLEGATLVDCGSGCGRLVVAALALWPELRCAVGVEKVEALHQIAVETVATLPPDDQRRAALHCGDAHELVCDHHHRLRRRQPGSLPPAPTSPLPPPPPAQRSTLHRRRLSLRFRSAA